MKNLSLILVLIAGFMVPNLGLSHNTGFHSGMGMMGYGMGGHNMYGVNMAQYNEGCHGLMDMGISTDYLLDYRHELDLSKTQVSKLETIRENYQRDVVALQAELQMAMYKLHNLLSDEDINTSAIRSANAEIEKIDSELRNRNIETYIAAKLILTREQLDKIQDLGLFNMQHVHGIH